MRTGDRVAAAVFAFDRSMRLMQIGLFLLLMLLSRLLKHCWRQPVFGIALGFGVFASVELILVSVVMWFGSSHEALISLSKSLAYNVVTVVWIGYLQQQPHLVPQVERATNANIFGMELAASGATPGPDASFMSKVEHAVDRVLSRHDWPGPSTEEKSDRGPEAQSR